MAWQLETNADFSLEYFDGDHFFIQSHEAEVLSNVCRYLQSAYGAPNLTVEHLRQGVLRCLS